MIIGIAGTLGSGKGTVVEYLKTKGFMHYSSSGALKEMLAIRGLPPTRKHLSELADELAAEYSGGILHISHERALREGAKDFVLEAIHRVSEAEFIHAIGGYVLGIDADLKTRFDRISARRDGEKDNVTYEQFEQDSVREDEGLMGGRPNIRAVLHMADSVVENNGTREDLYVLVDRVLASWM